MMILIFSSNEMIVMIQFSSYSYSVQHRQICAGNKSTFYCFPQGLYHISMPCQSLLTHLPFQILHLVPICSSWIPLKAISQLEAKTDGGVSFSQVPFPVTLTLIVHCHHRKRHESGHWNESYVSQFTPVRVTRGHIKY